MADLRRRNGIVLVVLSGVVAGMVGLSFAAVPLYQMFCQATGYGGTTQVAEEAPGATGDRTIVVRFNADVAGDFGWRFRPMQREITVRLGEVALAHYMAENTSDHEITGMATYNVTPQKVGSYFVKVECFCFTKQTLAPGERVEMPVSFFVDPGMATEPTVEEVRTITLSYMFFEQAGGSGGAKVSAALEQAAE